MTDAPPTRGFRPSTRRRNRLAAGIALGAVAVGGNVLVYSSLDDSEPVVQAVTDIPAGTRITSDMLRTIDVELDASVQAVSGDQLDLVPGRYARVRIVSGALVTSPSLQNDPLVTAGNAVVAVQVPGGALPVGLRERSRVQLVMPTSADLEPTVVEGRVVGLPSSTETTPGTVSLSLDVSAADATLVAAADDVRIVLLEPSPDEAITTQDAATDAATEAGTEPPGSAEG